MKLSDFDYSLPKNLIATKPASPRDHSRLLVLYKNISDKSVDFRIEHKKFYDILNYLNKGDVLVLNNSKVIPARLIGAKEKTGGKVEIFLHKKFNFQDDGSVISSKNKEYWQCIVGGKNISEGYRVFFEMNLHAEILKNNNDGTWNVKFNIEGKKFINIINNIGQMPIPPYINKQRNDNQQKPEEDRQYYKDQLSYQTVYARENKSGSVAAPTAGLHFTSELLRKIKKRGVQIEYVTLHVGLGTFAPVKTDDIKKHKMHSEYVEMSEKTANQIIKAKKERRRIIAVGTTSVRTLESMFVIENKNIKIKKLSDWVNIFIYPGYKFKIVDAMITNFHLPKSTLLMLVSAFAENRLNVKNGPQGVIKIYEKAITQKYRFYSYGDSMFIK